MKKIYFSFGLGLLLLVGFYFRWHYLQEISLYVDEFTTLWAARHILEQGVPVMPSGVLYTRGILSSYIEAAFLGVFGFSYAVGRLPSLLFGLATIVLIFVIGKREWNVRVGWLAAIGLTLLPEAIMWSGRARFYAQLQFFVLLAVWAGWRSIDGQNRFVCHPERSEGSGEAKNLPKEQRSFAALRMIPIQRSRAPVQRSRIPTRRVQSRANKKWQWLFALFFVLALYSQEETLLLYPSIVLAGWLWRGWRFFTKPVVLAAHALCLVAMGGRYLIEIWGQPGYFETIQAERPYVGLILDLPGTWQAYQGLLIAPERLSWTLLGVWAIFAAFGALWALQRRRGRVGEGERGRAGVGAIPCGCPGRGGEGESGRGGEGEKKRGRVGEGERVSRVALDELPRFHQATLFFALQFGAVFGVILLFVGETWRDPRYLFIVQPFWLLLGAAGAVWLVERFAKPRVQVWATTLLAVLALLSLLPAAQKRLSKQEEGYDLALGFVAQEREPDDVILTPQPPACALVLGTPCDYYAIQRRYEEYVILRDEVLIDRWSGAPLLNEASQLQEVVRRSPRTWFATDGLRLATRYDEAFIRTIIEQFDIVFSERGVLVLRANGWREWPTDAAQQEFTPAPARFGPLALTGWGRSDPFPSPEGHDSLNVKLSWQGAEPSDKLIKTFAHLISADGSRIAQDDSSPARNMVPSYLFDEKTLPDFKTLSLPANLAAGRYRIDVGAYESQTLTPLADPLAIDWITIGPPPAAATQPLHIAWQNGVQLLGHDNIPNTLHPGETFTLRLLWATDAPLSENYTMFVHLTGPDDIPLAQSDRPPQGGFYPTTAWEQNEPVQDHYTLTLPPDIPPGRYTLLTGLYRPQDFQRPPLAPTQNTAGGGGDAVELGTIEVVP